MLKRGRVQLTLSAVHYRNTNVPLEHNMIMSRISNFSEHVNTIQWNPQTVDRTIITISYICICKILIDSTYILHLWIFSLWESKSKYVPQNILMLLFGYWIKWRGKYSALPPPSVIRKIKIKQTSVSTGMIDLLLVSRWME